MIILTIPSASGWRKLIFKADEASTTINDDILVVSSIEIVSRFWHRRTFNEVGATGANLVDDYSVHIHQVLLSTTSLQKLDLNLCEWLSQYNHFKIELSGLSNQSFEIAVGQHEGTIYRRDKPALIARYAGEGFTTGEWSFVVDQSCLQPFQVALRQALTRWNRLDC